MPKVPAGLSFMPISLKPGTVAMDTGMWTGSGSCEAANNATFTVAAESSPVALRPTAIRSRGDSSEPSCCSCPRRRQVDRAWAGWRNVNFVILTSPKPVATDEKWRIEPIRREQRVARNSTRGSDFRATDTLCFLNACRKCHANNSFSHLGDELPGFRITAKGLEARQPELTACRIGKVSKVLLAMKNAHSQQRHLQRMKRTARYKYLFKIELAQTRD